MHTIEDSVRIDAPADKVYQAITTTEGERAWWTKDCEVGTRVGDQAAFRFDEGKMEVRFRIDELSAPQRVRWTCIAQKNNPDWQDTTVDFRIAEHDGQARVDFEHAGWREKSRVYEMCVGGWTHFLQSLKAYVETGKGTPHGA